MAEKITRTCDMHAKEMGGAEILPFSVDGKSYEIDVCSTHRKEFTKAVEMFVGHARITGKPPRRRTTPAPEAKAKAVAAPPAKPDPGKNGSPTLGGHSQREIRDWAAANGHKISNRGRIPGTVVKEFMADRSAQGEALGKKLAAVAPAFKTPPAEPASTTQPRRGSRRGREPLGTEIMQ